MNEINIAPYIKELLISDDPEYCNNGEENYCQKMIHQQFDGSRPYCTLFEEVLKMDHEKRYDQWDLRVSGPLLKKIKCTQCKEAYKKATIKKPPGLTTHEQ